MSEIMLIYYKYYMEQQPDINLLVWVVNNIIIVCT